MRRMVILSSLLLLAVTVFGGEITTKGAVAVQFTKKPNEGGLNSSFIRAEPKIATKSDKGLSGLIHLRIQPDFGSVTATKTVTNVQARQFYFELPVSVVNLRVGRWYQKYTSGYYFGRYLYELKTVIDTNVAGDISVTQGNGSMNTNYTIIDGIKLDYTISKSTKTKIELALITKDKQWKEDHLLIALVSSPIEPLTVKAGVNIEAISPDTNKVNRLAITLQYNVMKDLKVYGEFAMTDLSETSDNTWISAGLSLPTGGFLNQALIEIEYKGDRNSVNAVSNTDSDLSWMLCLKKKVAGLTLDLNVGADAKSLGSDKASAIGVLFRTTAGF